MKKLLCLLGIHDYTVKIRTIRPHKNVKKTTTYRVYEVTRCSRCSKAELAYISWTGIKKYEKCLGSYSQAKALEIQRCQEKK